MCVNKAIKKRDFTFCGPSKGPDSESHDGWWQNLQTKHQQLQGETLNLYKQENPPSNPKITILDWSSSSQKVTTQSEVTNKSVSGLNTPKEKASFVLRLLHWTCSHIVQK